MARKVQLPAWCRIVRDSAIPYGAADSPIVRDAADVFRLLRDKLQEDGEVEVFVAVLLNGKNRVLAVSEVSRGNATAALVHPRECFRLAVAMGACAIVLAHGHPSQDPTPSAEDRAITERLRQVGELIGIRVLDHVVCGGSRFVSMAEAGGW